MTTKEIMSYYADTKNRSTREDLTFATGLVKGNKIAIDCGCGAGSDIAYLRKKEFTVYGFDIEEEAIKVCKKRFEGDNNVILSKNSFTSFYYPKSNLIVADSSLFFCKESNFNGVWNKIYNSLNRGGIFCGSFLGPKDSMVTGGYEKGAYWSDISIFEENELREKFKHFEILNFTEHNVTKKDSRSSPHHWHIYSIVAQKIQ